MARNLEAKLQEVRRREHAQRHSRFRRPPDIEARNAILWTASVMILAFLLIRPFIWGPIN